MPYDKLSDLPLTVKDSLPKHAQEIFLAAFNSAFKEHGNEETAFKIAWSAVEKSYKKVDEKWERITKNMECVTNAEIINKEHDLILQRLNQKIEGLYYPEKVFAEQSGLWDGIPVIFGEDHPNFDLYDTNPTEALNLIKGLVVGTINSPKIETVGTVRLTGKFKTDNQIVENLIKSGKLAHSTGFRSFSNIDNDEIVSHTPHHVLLFIQDKFNQPKDKGAIILNKEGSMTDKKYSKEDMDAMLEYMKTNPSKMDKETMDKMYQAMDKVSQKEYMKSILKDLQSHPEMIDEEMGSMMKGMKTNSNKETKDTMGKEDELSKQLEISNKATETLKSELETKAKELEVKNAQLKVFEQEKAEQIKTEENARWGEVKNKLVPGLYSDAEKEKVLREMWVTNKDSFYMTHFVNAEKPALPGKEGNEHIAENKSGSESRVGNWNPITKQWEV